MRSPIRKVLSIFRRRRVRALLMGGQACIVYGGAEFSRDIDFAVAVDGANLGRIRRALRDLEAVPVFYPPLRASDLSRGHAAHFRCHAPGVRGLRIDFMTRMRGADPFGQLWHRRFHLTLRGLGRVPLVSLPDLVRIKKTQRDKDWAMLRRMVEADILRSGWNGERERLAFWFRECRSYEMLHQLSRRHPETARQESNKRPALRSVLAGRRAAAETLLRLEEERERSQDRRYWAPLQRELERWRLSREVHRPDANIPP